MLHEAILKGNLVIVKLLVDNGANLNYYHSPAVSGAIYMAIVKRHYEICKYLIERGSDPDLVGQNQSSLYLAAYDGRIDICRMLIERGVNINYLQNGEFSPLYVAA